MERPAKRPRLLTPRDSIQHANYNRQHEYYGILDYGKDNYEDEVQEQEVEGEISDPDQELQMKRAHADFKLKSTFEAIFEKYGKDFGGIGDEIDMRTGEVVIDNGHISSMRHEVDAGEVQSETSEDVDEDMSGSEEEDDDDDEEEDGDDDGDEGDEDDDVSEEDDEELIYDDEDPSEEVEDDDVILRGFTQASQQLQRRQQHKDRFLAHTESQNASVLRPSLPSRSQILAQFGPQLGPEIVQYVTEREGPRNSNHELGWRAPNVEQPRHLSNIEPAWRVPDIGLTHRAPVERAWRVPDIEPRSPPTPGRRPLIRSMVSPPDLQFERSPSPENTQSIWAVMGSKKSRKSARRKRFTPREDQLLLDFVADARRHGLDLSKQSTWDTLEAMDSRRTSKSWMQRYSTKHTYLRRNHCEESGLSTPETSSSTAQIPDPRLEFGVPFTEAAQALAPRPVDTVRPARARKQAQRDGFVSWSDASATIAFVDPAGNAGNAGLLDDARRTSGSMSYEAPVQSVFSHQRHTLEGSAHRPHVNQTQDRQPLGDPHANSLRSAEDELSRKHSGYASKEHLRENAPCPHADCKSFTATTYRLERGYDEDLSPMCSHLLCEHHITPFPCGEVDCERKGARGYFMQRDLIAHVKDAHPHAAAFHRLRGRVDSALLSSDQSQSSDQPRQSLEVDRGSSTSKHGRDSDFMATQRPYSVQGFPSTRQPDLLAGQDPDNTPRAGTKAVSASPSSMRVHPSPTKVNGMLSSNQRQPSADSDCQILDENPFEKSQSSQPEDIPALIESIELVGQDDATDLVAPAMSHRQLEAGAIPEALSKLPCEQTESDHFPSVGMNRDFQRSLKSPPVSQSMSTPLPPTIPNLQEPQAMVQSKSSSVQPHEGLASNIVPVQSVKPSRPVEQSYIDRSYEFSDDEDGILPVTRRPQNQPPVPRSPVSIPRSFFAAPIKAESLQTSVPSKPSATSVKSSSSIQPFVTPTSKPKSRKSAIRNVHASDELDELGFGENDFILLSSRPRSDNLPKLVEHVQIKNEAGQTQAPRLQTTKKRPFSSLHDDADVDELAEDYTFMTTPRQPERLPGLNFSTTAKVGIPGPSGLRPIKKPKTRTTLGELAKSHTMSLIQTSQTPERSHQLPSRTRTSLLDNVNGELPNETSHIASRSEIPSTSEVGSPVNAQTGRETVWPHSRFAVVVTPHKSWTNRTLKLEDENESVITPGGTVRKCGQDGFVCERAFCFRCDPDDVGMAE